MSKIPFTVDGDALSLLDEVKMLRAAVARVQTAWHIAREDDNLPQGFGWPGDLYDALEALD